MKKRSKYKSNEAIKEGMRGFKRRLSLEFGLELPVLAKWIRPALSRESSVHVRREQRRTPRSPQNQEDVRSGERLATPGQTLRTSHAFPKS